MTNQESGSESAHKFKRPIELKSDSDIVKLIPLRPNDAKHYFELIEFDREHMSQHGDRTADKYTTEMEVLASILRPENPSKLRFGIWDGDTMVGSNNLTPKDGKTAVLGSWVGKEYTGHKYAKRARAILVDYAFQTLDLDEVFCNIMPENGPSKASVESSGFHFDGEIEGQLRYSLKNPARTS